VIVIESARLALRRATVEDHPFIFELLNDPDWKRFISDKGLKTADEARDYIRTRLIAMYEKLGFGLYIVELKAGGAPIGMCGLIKRDTLEDVDLGFAFLPQFRGQGYAREAAAATLEYGRREFGLKRVVAITHPENESSGRLLEKLGFIFEKMVKAPVEGPDDKLFAYRCE
jgi:RimJ/RimL family protein N-acetyltransferase